MRYILLLILSMHLAVTSAAAADGAPTWPAEVRGYGLTVDLARKNALVEVVHVVTDYVHKLDPPLREWQVSEEFVEKHVISGAGSAGNEEVPIDDRVRSKSWVYRLKAPDVAQFTLLNRQATAARQFGERRGIAQERLLLAAWFFGGALALVSIAAAYGSFSGGSENRPGGAPGGSSNRR